MKVLFILESPSQSGVWKVTKTIGVQMMSVGNSVDVFFWNNSNFFTPLSLDNPNIDNFLFDENSNGNTLIHKFRNLIKKITGRFIFYYFRYYHERSSNISIDDYDKIFVCDLFSKIYCRTWVSSNIYYVFHNKKSAQIAATGGLGRYIDYFIFKNCIKDKNHIAVSSSVRDDLVTNFKVNKNNIIVIYNPFDFNLSKIERIPSQFEYYLCLGRLSGQKRIDRLLYSYSIFKNSVIGCIPKLIILGSGPEKNHLLSLSKKLKLEDCVVFQEYTSDVNSYIYNSKAIIISSDYEGFSTVTLEAISFKVNVLSVPIESMIEMSYLFEGIILSTSISSQSLAEVIIDFEMKNKHYPIANCTNHSLFEVQNVVKSYLSL